MDEAVMTIGDQLSARADELRAQNITICPPAENTFRALTLTPPETVKVCIIGQDPYHTPGAANGLAFSINKGRPIQPSLQNIFKELRDDVKCPIPDNGDLTPWAKQGVLLLNSVLTVTAGSPNSHKDWGWQEFTGHVFDICLNKLPQPIVFILWGANAQRIAADVDWTTHPNKMLIKSSHPSPMSADRGFFGSKPFSRANTFLTQHGVTPINWDLTALNK